MFLCLSTNGQTHARAIKGANAGTLAVKQLYARDFEPELDADLSDKMQRLMSRGIEAARVSMPDHEAELPLFFRSALASISTLMHMLVSAVLHHGRSLCQESMQSVMAGGICSSIP